MFSGFFSNPLDQRENNPSWLVISALSLLQHPESWSKGQLRAGAELDDGCPVASRGFAAPASCQRFLWLAVEMHEGFMKTKRCE